MKGALLTSARVAKREMDWSSDGAVAIGEIINPHALPMYRVCIYACMDGWMD